MKKKKTKLFLIFLLLLYAVTSNGQNLIRGTVCDEKGEPIIGATVTSKKNKSIGTLTDLNGKFSINLPDKNTRLVFSYIGYKTIEVPITGKNVITVTMQEEATSLNEVVVVGYQDIKRKDLTGAVGKLDMDDALKASVSSIDQALAGRIAGVQVSSNEGMPGGVMNIVIRGNNSVTQDNSPLYVIDGFPIEDPAMIGNINPNDIESFNVLKDASATAIYGSRGANGVIVITTKKGTVGSPVITYNFTYGVQRLSKKMKMMDGYEFVKLQSEILYPSDMAARYFKTYQDHTYTLEDYRNAEQFDWQDAIFQSAPQQNHNLSVTGGSQDARYNVSLSYYDQDGIVIRSNYNRMQARAGIDIRKNKLSLNFSTNLSKTVQTGNSPSQNSWSATNNLFYSVLGYRPVTQPGVSIYTLVDEMRDPDINPSFDYRFNPILDLKNAYNKRRTNNILVNGYAEYEILKGLKLKISGGTTYGNGRNETFNNSKTRYGNPNTTNGINASLGTTESISWLNENTITYNRTFNRKHNLGILGGFTMQEAQNKSNSYTTIQIPYESLGMAGMDQGTPSTTSSSITKEALMSYIGRVNYNYASKYYVTFSMRADASSKFDKSNRWGYFPSTALAWVLSDEKFFKPLKKYVDRVKVRMGWGETGNNRVGAYSRYSLLDMVKNRELKRFILSIMTRTL